MVVIILFGVKIRGVSLSPARGEKEKRTRNERKRDVGRHCQRAQGQVVKCCFTANGFQKSSERLKDKFEI